MKKILFSVLMIGVVTALVAGGTIAYFTTSASAPATSFATGTLSLELGGQMSAAVDFSSMLPGHWYKKTLTVKNNGNYDELYKLAFKDLTNPDGKWLAGQITVQLYYHDNHPEDGTSNPGWGYAGLLTNCTSDRAPQSEYMLRVGNTDTWDIYFMLNADAGNQYQNASTQATLQVNAQQYNPPQDVTLP
ncbi:MAG: CalY family protein [Thermoleophilia bacterium]|nr:CalY family protein [Thermoleophilia bacterium]